MSKNMSEAKQKCCGVVFYRGWPHACTKTPKVDRDGKWYCGFHDPVAINEKQKKKKAKWEQQWAKERKDAEDLAKAIKLKNHRAACFPDLLEALKLCQKQLQGLSFKDSQIVEALERTQAAIAKAEGGEA